jgi:hypothetical protein
LELAWGIWDRPSASYHARCAELERVIVARVLGLLEAFEIPATWAIVGRLLDLDESAARSTIHGAQVWYAPDLIDLVRGAQTRQEIGSHGYRHAYFTELDREAARADVESARRIHQEHGLPFESFVYPRNKMAHVDVLREAGIRVFRSSDCGWHVSVGERFGRTPGRIAHLVDHLLPLEPVPVRRIDRVGMFELPGSMLLMGRNGFRRIVAPAVVVAKARRGLEAACRTGGVFHLWFHPSNFYFDTARQLDILGRILGLAAAMRSRGELDIRTLGSYADA